MPRIRQTARCAPVDEHLVVRTLAVRYPPGYATPRHAHPWAQLVYAIEGVVTVRTERGVWVVPTHRAVWIPAAEAHALETAGHVGLRTLYLREDVVGGLPEGCFVFAVRPLLRELIAHVVERRFLDDRESIDERLARVLVDQIDPACEEPLSVPEPRDPRARRLAARLFDQPGNSTPLAELAAGCGASPRTLERLFAAETGLSLSRWRQRVRVLHGLRRLAAGESVTRVALELGYESTSAFISMFRREVGTTPGRWKGGG